jgi:lipopolysaccharide/colanic/teichoic acid biosynthesis glycosyltransferase
MQVELASEVQSPQLSRPRLTLWDISAEELHDRLWASVGVRVVRRGRIETSLEELHDGTVYLLLSEHALIAPNEAAFRQQLARNGLSLLLVRLSGERRSRFVERVVTGPSGDFQRFERDYRGAWRYRGKCAVTSDRELARQWRTASRATAGWRWLRGQVARQRWAVTTIAGRAFNGLDDAQVVDFVGAAISIWTRPDLAVAEVMSRGDGIWMSRNAAVDDAAAVLGSAWVGRNHRLDAQVTIVGPAVFWDRNSDEGYSSDSLNSGPSKPTLGASRSRFSENQPIYVPGKRAFDLTFAFVGLCLTLPFYPLLMLMIWIEDGGPFFFGQRREGRGGREFRCWKLRSMRKDAEQMQGELKSVNQADGPQFYMKNDPRLTRIGALLRKFNLDELPQFWNVLKGDMSVVGPRPSPHRENQFCPEWREARLSVRPGITGLWQVKRTRRPGCDFQEWVQFDTEYVDRAGWRLDLWIIACTILNLLKRGGQ